MCHLFLTFDNTKLSKRSFSSVCIAFMSTTLSHQQFIKNKNRNQPKESDSCDFHALSHKDSNLIKQNQNLLCYHYTMGQCYAN